MALFVKKELTHEERIAEAQGKLADAQSMFVKAKEEVDASDEHLTAVEREALAKMNELQAILDSVAANKEKNDKFKAKLAEFIDFD